MGITELNQLEFLDICKYFGGHCDCEILMNAYIKFSERYGIDIDLFEG